MQQMGSVLIRPSYASHLRLWCQDLPEMVRPVPACLVIRPAVRLQAVLLHLYRHELQLVGVRYAVTPPQHVVEEENAAGGELSGKEGGV